MQICPFIDPKAELVSQLGLDLETMDPWDTSCLATGPANKLTNRSMNRKLRVDASLFID